MADAPEKSSALEKRIKKHVIGKPHRFTAVAPLGFEETLVEELKFIGVEVDSGLNCAAGIKVAGDGKVEFTAKITEAWKAVAYSRIANRVLMEIGNFKAENFGQLEKGVAGIPWELFLDERTACGLQTKDESCSGLVLHVTCKHSRLYHSDAVEERVRKIIDQQYGEERSGVALDLATEVEQNYVSQNLYVTLIDDRCTLWLDLAGEELYKRGHERFVAEAPLKETIAAAMFFEASKIAGARNPRSSEGATSALKASTTLPTSYGLLPTIIDPMAGSGTFSLEAAYIANGLIPGKCRDFALKHQPAFKEGTWNFILKGAEAISPASLRIITSDISQRPIDIIKHNVEVSPLAEIAQANPDAGTINPQLKDFFSYSAQDIPDNSIILLNPPYGKRLAFDAPKLYTKIGQKITEWSRDAQSRNSDVQSRSHGITVAILVPKDCMQNLLQACPAFDARKNPGIKLIETSHGGFSLNAIFGKI